MMEGNKYLHLNSQKCERLLSTFGKKVLNELIKQRDKAQEEISKYRAYRVRRCSPTKKILNFNDESLHNTPTTTPALPPPIQFYNAEVPFNLNIIGNISPKVPTLEESIKTIDIHKNMNNDKFVHPTITSRNIVHEAFNIAFDREDDLAIIPHVDNLVESVGRTERTDVHWDNMFDSELFNDFTGNDFTDNAIAHITFNVSDAIIQKEPSKGITKNDENNDEVRGDKRKNSNILNTKNKKARKQKDKPDEITKSSNKISNDVPKINFRKQKYTKTVKNWLNDVASFNPINEDVDMQNINSIINDKEMTKASINEQHTTHSPTDNNNKFKIVIDKSVKKVKKNVIQAQLAIKDGIMKFSKPKTKIVESNNEVAVAETKVVKDKKEKKIKKFVPPRSSQVPVKEVTYDVLTVDETNINECINKIHFGEENEIVAVLMYSNGFCQLNSHYTDDTCVADSLLLATGDVFYCFKGVDQKLKETLASLLETNIVISYEARSILIYLTSILHMKIHKIKTYDVKIGASLLDPDNPPENFSGLQKLLSTTAMYKIASECPQQKASWYSTLLKESWIQLKQKLEENQLWRVFVEIETKLLPIIAEMECWGVLIDLSKLKSMEETLLARMKLIEQKCYGAAGKVFQINSAVQVRAILYDELQLDSKCNVKIRETLSGGLKSTSETMLRSLISVHALPKLILEYRHLHKAHATFVAGIAQHVKDNVVRPTWSQMAAATGRIASNNPNLQAIPKVPFNLVMFPDDDEPAGASLQFRAPYVARVGCRLLAADFKHIECRVFAHVAADGTLTQALAQAEDLFAVLAAHWLNKPEDSVTGAERERTKRLVYASLYGAGTRKLMEILDVSYEQALQVAASFNRTFPSLKSFGRQVVSKCSQSGGRLSTLCGRVRHFANINNNDFGLRSHAERQAVNFVVQGSAADLCKRAMILTEEQLRGTSPPLEARLLLQIHDELVWEVASHHVPAAADIIKRVMEGCGEQCGMALALPVALRVGDNWAAMDHYPGIA